MLTGVSPLIYFIFYEENPVWKKGETDAVDKDGKSLVGQPITPKEWSQISESKKWLWHRDWSLPIYLWEEKIEMAVDDAEQTISVDNNVVGDLDFGALLTNTVRITLTGSSDNVVLIALMSALSEVVKRIAQQRYSIALYYNSILILNGRFTNITQSTIQNSNQKVISISIADLPYKEATTKDEQANKPGELQNKASKSSLNPEG